MALLMSINPALILLVVVRRSDNIDVGVAARKWRGRRRSVVRKPIAWRGTLFYIATTAPSGKEVRVMGIGE